MIYVYGIWEGKNGVELGISDGYIVSGTIPSLRVFVERLLDVINLDLDDHPRRLVPYDFQTFSHPRSIDISLLYHHEASCIFVD